MIQGRLVTLRTATSEERNLIYNMGLRTEYMRQCFAQVFERGFESFKEAYTAEYFDGREPCVRGGLMVCLGETPIGFASYGQINNFTDRAWVYHWGTMELDIWLDGEQHCGKGYGVDAIATLSDHLHKTYNISRCMICPERINPRAIRSYEKAGFREVAAGEKQKVLLEIFHRRGLAGLRPDDEYFADTSYFMIKDYGDGDGS